MINHLRTLLVHQDGSAAQGDDFPGEEYVPPDYRAPTLPAPVRRAWEAYFGVAPERAYRNWRVRELLACVHATGLERYALELDGRLTYREAPNDAALAAAPRAAVTGARAAEVAAAGRPEPDDAAGVILRRYRVSTAGGGAVGVEAVYPRPEAREAAAAAAGGRRGPVALGDGVILWLPDEGGLAWEVETLARPGRGPAELLAGLDARLGAGTAEALALFQGSAAQEAAGRVWAGRDEGPWRLAAYAVALAYAIEGAR